jgi:DNA polymerase III epsilon subunit-like protein
MFQPLPKTRGNEAERSGSARSSLPQEVLQRSLWEQPFYVLDCEATGLDYRRREPCEIAIARFVGGREEESRVWRVKTSEAISPQASALHHITNADLEHAPFPHQVASEIRQFLGNQGVVPWVGYMSVIDAGFLGSFARRYGFADLEACFSAENSLCTKTLGKMLNPDVNDFGDNILQFCAACGVTAIPDAHHTAAGDVIMTARLFEKMLHDVSERGIKTVGELLDLQHEVLQTPFGIPSRGAEFSEINKLALEKWIGIVAAQSGREELALRELGIGPDRLYRYKN